MREESAPVPLRAEITGWLAFALFVLSIWRLREWLNRGNGDE